MTLNVGILGAGWFGREAHVRNLLKLSDAAVVAASSRSEASRSAVKQLVGDELQVFENWQDVIADDRVDAIIVALTNDQHHQAAMAALNAGKHVLCEKPLGLTLTECDQIIAAAESNQRVLQVGHEMRHQALYQQMKQRIADGQIGDPKVMWCREYRGPMRPGWRSEQACTGGLLLEKNCHHFDLFNWMFDRRPTKVAAFGGTDVLNQTELMDNAQVLVEYEGGCRAVLEICLFAPKGGDCEIGVVGTNGRMDSKNQALELTITPFDDQPSETVLVPDPDDEAGFKDASGRVDRGIKAQLIEFVDCCRSGRQPLNNGPSARANVAVCLAAQESIKSGSVVQL